MVRGMLASTLLWSAIVAAAAPHSSFHQLVTSNGHTAVIYDASQSKLTGFREHLYRDVGPGSPVRELAWDAYFGLRLGGTGSWLTGAGAPQARYLPGTGIIEAVQQQGAIEATTYLFAPFDLAAPAAAMLLRIKNTGASALGPGDSAFSIHNFHLGDGPNQTAGERIDWDSARNVFVERGQSGRAMVFRPLAAPARHGATPDNPYPRVLAGQDLIDTASSGVVDDAVSGFQWSLEGLAPGAERWFGVAFAYHPFGDDRALSAALEGWAGSLGPTELLAREQAGWAAWSAKTVEPAGLSADERAVFHQQLAVLRMAQVREPNDPTSDYRPHGQLLASLPPGGWNITWVRDASVAIRALARAGHLEEAGDALAFFLNAQPGNYLCCDRGGGPYVGAPYQISVCRYYGKGAEESDENADGPNLEWDGFGMFLDALDSYERAGGEPSLVEARWAVVSEKIGDVLESLVEGGGLLRADSSIWESHWENGGRQHWAWSNIYGVVGLRAAAALAERHGRSEAALRYRRAAENLAKAFAGQLVEANSFLRGRADPTDKPEDASVVEAFLRAVLPGDGPVAVATLRRLTDALKVPAGHGFRRNLGPSEYDAREWIFVDLLMAGALRRVGRAAEADALLSWVTAQARANYDLIPENFDPTTADYAGAVPMVGFGAGAYVRALFERIDPPEVAPAPDDPDAGAGPADAGPSSSAGKGCGCATPGSAVASSLLLAAGLVLRRRRA